MHFQAHHCKNEALSEMHCRKHLDPYLGSGIILAYITTITFSPMPGQDLKNWKMERQTLFFTKLFNFMCIVHD